MNSQPLGSASVYAQGTAITTVTGDDGRFSITVPEATSVLVVRHLGYKRVAVQLANVAGEMSVTLEKDALQLDAQIITGTATSIASQNAANSVALVSGAELNRVPTPTVENAMQGKIPGAVITTNSGAPGGGTQVQIRGATSINASSSPLYVVDGVLVSNAETHNDLHAITNSNGPGEDQMVNRIADLNPADIDRIEVLKGASAGAIYGSKASNGVIVITTKRGQGGPAETSITQRLGQFSISRKLGFRCFGSEAEAQAWWGGPLPSAWTPACHDFEQEYYSGNPMSYETDLSIRGGNQQTTFYLGGLAKRDNAIARNSYYQKQSLAANVSQLIGRVNVRSNNTFMHSLTDRGVSGNDNYPTVNPVDVFAQTPSFFDLKEGERNPYLGGGEGTNPFQTASSLKAPEDVFRYIGSVSANLSAFSSPRQALDLIFVGGVDAFQYAAKILAPASLYFEDADGLPGTIASSRENSVNANLNASGVHRFVTDRLTATTSFGLRKEQRQNDQLLNEGRNVPEGQTNVPFGTQQSVSESQFLVRDESYYSQEELLLLDERLLLTAAINAERSSANGDDRKFYSYPKFAASYRLRVLSRFIDQLKLRAAFGKAGNQPPFGIKFTTLDISPYEDQLTGRLSSVAGNPRIRPETSTETEGGLDATFWDNRVTVEATVFDKTVTDLILKASVPPSSGYSSKWINGGTLVNKGAEVSVVLTPVQFRELQWLSRTTYARVRGQITRLNVPSFNPVFSFGPKYGQPRIEQGRSPTIVRVFNGCTVQQTVCPAANRVTEYVESAPDFSMSFSNEITIRGLRVFALLEWRKGGKAINITNASYLDAGLGHDTAASQARAAAWDAGKGVYFEDAGFLKLRELSATYSLPQHMKKALFASSRDVVVQLSGRNLYTWTKYSGYDPEVSNFSNQNVGRFQDILPYPPSRSVFVSVRADF